MSRLTDSIVSAVTLRWWLRRSRQWQVATTRQLDIITQLLRKDMNAHEAITLAVNNAVSAMQAAIDQLAEHATTNDDDELNALASRLQNSVSALSTAATRHGVDVPTTGTTGGDTISGAGSQPVSTTSDTVSGAGSLTQGGAASFPDGQPAQGDQTGTTDNPVVDTPTGPSTDPSLTSRRR